MSPVLALRWFMVGWLAAVAALVTYRVATGRVALDGLLSIKGERFSIERLQLLLITLGVLVVYVAEAMSQGLSAKSLPDVPNGLLPILVGSHAVYLGGKIARR